MGTEAVSPKGGRRPVLVKACLNGGRRPDEHPAIPLTPQQLALEARGAVEAGAAALHVHPRRPDGSESLEPEPCAAAVEAIREAAPGVPVGLTTGAWIEPDNERRLASIESWTVPPDFASVNFFEEGVDRLCRILQERGIGIEAGLTTVADAEALVESGWAGLCVRLLVEVEADEAAASIRLAADIDATLDAAGVTRPRLHHGFGLDTWSVIERALGLGHDVRIGLEDTLYLPDRTVARDNADLVAAVVGFARRAGRIPSRGLTSPGSPTPCTN